MRGAIETVERAFRLEGLGRANTPPKADLSCDLLGGRGWFSAMMSCLADGVCGLKWVGSFDRSVPRVSGVVVLNTSKGGLPIAVMDAAVVTTLRTGASVAVAAKYLVKDNAPLRVALIGPGRVGRSCLEALRCVRSLREVRVVGRTVSRARAFARVMRDRLSVPVTVATDRGQAVEGADIVVTATSADIPQFPASAVGPGVFIASIGSHAEVEPELFRRADKIVVDSLAQSRTRGAIARLLRTGELRADTVTELGVIASGGMPGREHSDEMIVACLTGIASTDVAIAARIYAAARRHKIGTAFRFLE